MGRKRNQKPGSPAADEDGAPPAPPAPPQDDQPADQPAASLGTGVLPPLPTATLSRSGYGACDGAEASGPLLASRAESSGRGSTAVDCSDSDDESTDERDKNRAVIALRAAMAFCIVFMVVELVGGYIAHSLAILTDAAHLLTDVGAFALSLFSLHASKRGACETFSFGWHRAEVLGTLASVFTIWALVGAVVFEAVNRTMAMYKCASMSTHDPAFAITCEGVNAPTMVVVGALGLLVNVCCAVILSFGGGHAHSHSHGGLDHGHGAVEDEGDHGHSHEHSHSHGHGHGEGSLAVNAAFLHALGDSVQSVGVIVAGGFIWFMNLRHYGTPSSAKSIYNLADPVGSLLFAVITLYTTKGLFRDIMAILMESTPPGINYTAVLTQLQAIDGVVSVHDLHIWSLSAGKASLSAHIVSDRGADALRDAQRICERHGIGHTTIQVDLVKFGSDNCGSALGCHGMQDGKNSPPGHSHSPTGKCGA